MADLCPVDGNKERYGYANSALIRVRGEDGNSWLPSHYAKKRLVRQQVIRLYFIRLLLESMLPGPGGGVFFAERMQ